MELKQGDRVFVSVTTNSAWTGTGVVTKTRNGTPYVCVRMETGRMAKCVGGFKLRSWNLLNPP
jgi:hypothetical protein